MEVLDHQADTPVITTAAPCSTTRPGALEQAIRAACRVKHYSLRTERTYIYWIRWFIRFHGLRHPLEMGAAEVEAFLSHLATQREVAAGTQNQAMHASSLAGGARHVYPSRVAGPTATGIGVPNGAARSRKEFSLRLFCCLGVSSNGRPGGRSRKARRCSIGTPTPVSVAHPIGVGSAVQNRKWSTPNG